MKTHWLIILSLLITTAAWAEDTAPADSKAADSTTAKPAPKKAPSTMEKAGNEVKSDYHKTVHTLKKHGHKAPCTKAQKSMHECNVT